MSSDYVRIYSEASHYSLSLVYLKIPIPRDDENGVKSTVDHKLFIAESRRHIGADEWKMAPFWRPINLIK